MHRIAAGARPEEGRQGEVVAHDDLLEVQDVAAGPVERGKQAAGHTRAVTTGEDDVKRGESGGHPPRLVSWLLPPGEDLITPSQNITHRPEVVGRRRQAQRQQPRPDVEECLRLRGVVEGCLLYTSPSPRD